MNTVKSSKGVSLASNAFANAAANTAPAKSAPVAPVIVGMNLSGIEIPATKTTARGSKSPYPFDALETGHFFGVKGKKASDLSSIISNQNRKKDNRKPKTDENGNVVYKMAELKDASGNVIGKQPTTEPETVPIKEFRAFDVTADIKAKLKGTEAEGSTVLVFRVK